MGSATDWVAVSGDWRHAHGLTTSGQARAWGRQNRLGDGSLPLVAPRPAQVVTP